MSGTFDPFDELAAMFLTSPAPKPPTAAGSDDAEPPHGRPGHRPMPANEHPAGCASAPAQAHDHASPGAGAAPFSPAISELVIVGNLPVRASLWLTPYADMVARQLGTTALVRLDRDEPDIQVLRGEDSAPGPTLGPSLSHAVTTIAPTIDVWLLRAASACPATDLLLSGPDRITILSSADEAATVAAYQIVKELGQAAEQTHRALPPLRMAVVGVDAAQAAAVVERLNRTTISFLGVEVRLASALARIDASVRPTRYASFPQGPCPHVSEVMSWIRQASYVAASAQQAVPPVAGRLYADRMDAQVVDAARILEATAPAPVDHAAGKAATTRREPLLPPDVDPSVPIASPDTALPTVPGPQPVAGPSHGSAAAAAAEIAQLAASAHPSQDGRPQPLAAVATPVVDRIKIAPKPSRTMESKQPQRPAEPDDRGMPVALAAHVEGLTLLPVRAPGHERIELAIDNAGGLHLLCRETSLRELNVVEAWSRLHAELIGMACPHHVIDRARRVQCHVFSDRPLSLADLHGTEFRLHVLAPVTVGSRTAWYCAPLNAPA